MLHLSSIQIFKTFKNIDKMIDIYISFVIMTIEIKSNQKIP